MVVAGRRDEAGKALVIELRSLGSEAEFINADVRRDDDVRNMVDQTVARFGRLDVAVNNAATEGQVGPITDQTAESFAATFETNVLGVVLSMKHEVRAMQAQGRGNIINISSTYGHEGAANASIYVGAKHAVEGMTKSVALELAKSGIRVERRRARPHRHRHADSLHPHGGKQGGLGDAGSVGSTSASPRKSATASCSSLRTKPGSSRDMSSTSMADTPPTDPVRARRFAPHPVKGGGCPEAPPSQPGPDVDQFRRFTCRLKPHVEGDFNDPAHPPDRADTVCSR